MRYLKRYKFAIFLLISVCIFWCIFPLMSRFLVAAPTAKKTATVKPVEPAKQTVKKAAKQEWHPPHIVKTWTTSHNGSKFRITQIPRCGHVETLFTYDPTGETIGQAKRRVNGITAISGSFHHPQSYVLADFFQMNGRILAPARTGRAFLVVLADGSIDITKNYAKYKGKPKVSAMAMGQVLVPWQRDGFSASFMKQKTDRMAIAMNRNYIFIVQGKCSIYTLASYIKKNLPVHIAVNSDGGHVVRGVAPVHVVFRWKPKGIARELLK